jgi:hypothetical protein
LERRPDPFGAHVLFEVEPEQRWQRREHWIGCGVGAAKEPADHLRSSAGSAVMDREQPAVRRRSNDITPGHWRQVQVAAHQMQVVARKQHDLAGANHDLVALAVNPDVQVALDNVVIDDQVGCGPERWRAMFRRHTRDDAPRRPELGVEEHTAGEVRHPQDIRQGIHVVPMWAFRRTPASRSCFPAAQS